MSKCLINYDLVDIVDKINGGDILPIGDSSYDVDAYRRLEQIELLIEHYIDKTIEVAEIGGRAASIDIAREEARDFLKDIYEQLKDAEVG
jgi:hypothetical protein